jgi:hypothetical protein
MCIFEMDSTSWIHLKVSSISDLHPLIMWDRIYVSSTNIFPRFQTIIHFSFIWSQTSLISIKFIEKYTDIYKIKLISLTTKYFFDTVFIWTCKS